MSLHSWGNGFAAAALVLTVGVAAAQAPAGSTRTYAILAASAIVSLLAIALLRPRPGEKNARQLNDLRERVSVRDIAFLRIGTQLISFPETIDRNSVVLAPIGEKWTEESKDMAHARAQKLLSLGLMEPRGPEVETSALGRALVAFDDLVRAERSPIK
jgi:hypothetical protein